MMSQRIPRTVGVLALSAATLAAQTHSPESVPTLEPRLTKLYGSDSLDLWGPSTGAALSPSGRWVVFNTVEGADRANLWIASVEGGDARRLTDGLEFNAEVRWFPGGDRIAFRSNRFAQDESSDVHIVSLGVDPETGRPTGPMRQITLDPTWGNGYAISADGKWIAYTTSVRSALPGFGRTGPIALKIVPSTGGSARTLVEREAVFEPAWAPDGGSVYFVTRRAATPHGDLRDPAASVVIMRVATAGGPIEEVGSWSVGEAGSVWLSADARYVCREVAGAFEISTIEGMPVGRFELPEKMSLDRFASDGRTFLATMQVSAAPLKVLPVGGGAARQLNEARSWDWPVGWTADGGHVVFSTRLNGENILMLAPMRGGPMRQIPIALDSLARGWGPALSDDGRHLFYATSEASDAAPTGKILDIETGRVREVSRALWNDYVRYNLTDGGDQFLYAEEHGERVELRAIRPKGPSRLLGSFAPDEFPNGFAARGDQIAFTRPSGAETSVFVAAAGANGPKKVLTHPGQIASRGMWRPEWSPDGSMLALSYAESPAAPGMHAEGYARGSSHSSRAQSGGRACDGCLTRAASC